ncbi:MAG: HVA1 family protein [Mycobacterium sp.]
MAENSFSKGAKVQWKSHGQNEDPQYRVKSSKTGADAVHKPDTLRHRKD